MKQGDKRNKNHTDKKNREEIEETFKKNRRNLLEPQVYLTRTQDLIPIF